eukprot:CAMPEP_0183331110 /NCGR_PEP_ID=MMETSP0164_2-20130417/518_1 /TAXON_ID=221442 /ORGANISM="Coccolithus pelagicus ssp braarudi, Strain PLY182g" /LENGTH=44 /DNA_ID= /DNA_START= /DNA_END= /DNA_ORIENTATION=
MQCEPCEDLETEWRALDSLAVVDTARTSLGVVNRVSIQTSTDAS